MIFCGVRGVQDWYWEDVEQRVERGASEDVWGLGDHHGRVVWGQEDEELLLVQEFCLGGVSYELLGWLVLFGGLLSCLGLVTWGLFILLLLSTCKFSRVRWTCQPLVWFSSTCEMPSCLACLYSYCLIKIWEGKKWNVPITFRGGSFLFCWLVQGAKSKTNL